MPITPCPAGCGRTVQSGKLLCYPCWSAVAVGLQANVLRTWRARLLKSDAGTVAAHRAAVDAALASLR